MTMPKRAHSIQEVADTLGINRVTVYRLLERGELKSIKVGRRRLILAEELERYLAACAA